MRIKLEAITSSEGSSFAVLEKKARQFPATYHLHPELELTEIVKGKGARLVGDDLSPFSDGDLVLLGANLPHRYISDLDSPGVSHARVIQFAANFLGDGFLQAAEMARLRQLFAKAARGLTFSAATTRAARGIIDRVFAAEGMKKLLHLLELLELLASAKRGQPIASGGYVCAADLTDANNVSKALSFMHAHLSEPITLDEVSEVLGVSPATSNRLFRRSLGKSFKEFLVDLRIAHACRLLAETEDSIIHVAQASGFGNLANFNRLFKSRKRKTPRDFRSGVQAEGTT